MNEAAIKGITGDELFIGQKESFGKVIDNDDVVNFSNITGDKNPIHLNDEYAKNTMYGTRIAHGMIGAGVISALIGMKLPGPGTIYLNQEISFKKAVMIGDKVTANAEVIDIIKKEKFYIVKIRTACYNQNNDMVIDGIATVIPPKNDSLA